MQLREQRQQKLNAMVMASLRNQRLDVRNSSTGTSSKAISGTVVAEEDYNDEDDITSELLLQSDDHDTGIGQYTDELEMDAGLEDAAEEEEEEDQSSLFSNDLNNNHILGQNHNSLLNKSFGQLPLLPTSKAKRAASTRSTFGQLESGTSIWPDYELNTSQKIQQQLASLASPLLDYSSLFDLGAAAKLSNNRKTNGSSRATSASQSSRTKAGSNKLPNPSIASSLASLGSISSMSNMAKIASLTAGGAATISNESETPSHHPSACNLNSNDSDHLVVSVNPSELLDERLSEKSKPSELSAFRDQSDDISFSGQLKYLNQSQFDPQVSSTAVTTPIRSSNAVSTGATTPTTAKSTRRSNSSSGESKSSKSKRRSSEEKGESHVRPKALETEPSMAKIASSAAAYLASEEFDSDDKNGFLGKKCVCPYCPQTFTQRNSLNRHIRSHTGERPFPCEFCGKCFSDKQRLLIHTRIHTGEKPFSCSICYRKFTQKSTVKRHLIVHFGHSSGKADEARAKQFAKAKSKELNELILCSLKPIPKPGEPEPEMPVKTGLSPAAAKLLRQSVNNNLRRPPPLQRIPKQNAGKSLLDHQRKEGPASSNGFLRSPSAGLKRPKLEKIGRKSLSLPEDEDDGGDAGDEFEGDNDDDFKNVDLSESGGDMNHMSQEFEADDDEEEDEVEDEEEDEDEMMDEEEDEDTPDHQLDQLQIKEGDKNDDDKVKSQLEIFDGKDNLLKEEKETDNADEIVS